MKKSLIALAILASTSGAAMAQSSVSIYGVVDMGFQSQSDGVNRTNSIDSGMANGTRLGFKGTEDLGNGLKAGFVLETGLEADTGGDSNFTGAWGEQSIVYLQGDSWGKVTLGHQFSPIRNSLLSVDPFTTSYTGDARYVFNNFQNRVKNAVSYSSNNYGGFSGNVVYGAGEVPGDNSARRTLGFNVNYASGPVAATLAYNKLNGLSGQDAQKQLFLGGTYDFGVVKAHLGYGDYKEGAFKQRSYLMGVSAPVGQNGKVLASYNLSDVRSFDEADSAQLSVGYTHDLSKRTYVYSMYSHMKNDDNVGLRVAQNGKNGNTFQVGVRHSF